MFCPDTKMLRLEIAACGAVVAGDEENGEFIGEPRAEEKPFVAPVKVDVRDPFAEPFIVAAI